VEGRRASAIIVGSDGAGAPAARRMIMTPEQQQLPPRWQLQRRWRRWKAVVRSHTIDTAPSPRPQITPVELDRHSGGGG
jgi:hypothetical protein